MYSRFEAASQPELVTAYCYRLSSVVCLCVCVYVCLMVTFVSPTRRLNLSICCWGRGRTDVDPRNHVLDVIMIFHGKGQFWGLPALLKSIGSPCSGVCKDSRAHSCEPIEPRVAMRPFVKILRPPIVVIINASVCLETRS